MVPETVSFGEKLKEAFVGAMGLQQRPVIARKAPPCFHWHLNSPQVSGVDPDDTGLYKGDPLQLKCQICGPSIRDPYQREHVEESMYYAEDA